MVKYSYLDKVPKLGAGKRCVYNSTTLLASTINEGLVLGQNSSLKNQHDIKTVNTRKNHLLRPLARAGWCK